MKGGRYSLQSVLRRDRLIVALALTTVVLVSVGYTVLGIGMDMSAWSMTRMAIEMPGMAMAMPQWTLQYAFVIFLMWWIMMIAMMLPSAAPMILLHNAIVVKRDSSGPGFFESALFVFGYLLVWAAFSIFATLVQWVMDRFGILTGMMDIASPAIAGAILVAAGAFQFSPLKQACLRQCRHPLGFVLHHWRSGSTGALKMGFSHGSYCVGCCWFLMALLFVGGIMNLIWIAGIAIFVAMEKFAADSIWLTRLSGAVLVLAGLAVLISGT